MTALLSANTYHCANLSPSLVPPLYSPNVSDYAMIEGSSPRVQLALDAALRITSFEWTRNEERIQGDDRRVLFSDAIVFDPISRDDIGTYRVTATDNLGSGQATVNIDVYCKYCNSNNWYPSILYREILIEKVLVILGHTLI